MTTIPYDEPGLLLRRTAVARGLDDNWLGRMVREGTLVRIRQGAYAERQSWQQRTPAQRHRLLSQAVMLQYDDRVALSHASAHLARGGPDWGLDLGDVNVTNLFARGDRRKAGVTHHRGAVRVGDVSRHAGHWITSPARTAVETAATSRLEPAIAVLDWTLHAGLASRDELMSYAEVYMREWPDSVELPVAVRRSNGLAESVGESRSRIRLEDMGLRPEPQWVVHHPSGSVAGRVDMRIRELGLMVEFDGAIKYGRLLRPGQTIEDVIRAERAREVLLEELTGLRMFRLIWTDLDDADLEARIHRAARARRAA